MTFIKVNGITIPVAGDSFEEEQLPIGDVSARSAAGILNMSMATTKRRWTFTTPILAAALAEQYRIWIEGRTQVFGFGTNLLSAAGCTTAVAATPTHTATGGHIAGRVTVASAEFFGVNLLNKFYRPLGWSPTDGWTIGFWTFRTIASDSVSADAWYDYVVSGAVSVVRGSSANPASVTQWRDGVVGSFNAGIIINVEETSPFVGVAGYRLGGVALAKDYSDLFFVPFAMPDTWRTELNTFRQTNELGLAPMVKVSGDWVPDATPVSCIGRCRTIRQRVATLKGASASTSNNRILEVTLEEV